MTPVTCDSLAHCAEIALPFVLAGVLLVALVIALSRMDGDGR